MFYSQTLEKIKVENVCARCEKHFPTWGQYHAHAVAQLCARKLTPINLSGRSKAQIVANWELTHKEYLI